jgi:hypothetical protein
LSAVHTGAFPPKIALYNKAEGIPATNQTNFRSIGIYLSIVIFK